MSTTTSKYGLVKPALTDVPDITAMNSNWDTIDSQLAAAVKKDGSVPMDSLTVGTRKAGSTVGTASFVSGTSNEASGSNTVALGSSNTAKGSGAYAEGYNNVASGIYAHAEGDSNTASGYGSHAEGWNTKAVGDLAHAEGSATLASRNSHSEGAFTMAAAGTTYFVSSLNDTAKTLTLTSASGLAVNSLIDIKIPDNIGLTQVAIISINGSTIKLNTSSSLKNATHIVLRNADGLPSHAEGLNTLASGILSHAEGNSNVAAGETSHAGGNQCQVAPRTYNAFAHGFQLRAAGSEQAVFGRYNAGNTTDLFQVGMGTSDNDRKNAMRVTSAGDIVSGSGVSLNSLNDKLVGLIRPIARVISIPSSPTTLTVVDHFTIPSNSVFSLSASGWYNNSPCLEIALSTNGSHLYMTQTDVICPTVTFSSYNDTYTLDIYVHGKWQSPLENSIVVRGWYMVL